jgi:hypothetical protein
VAIDGASFGSSGDAASKGTGGGIISANTEGPTTFIAPGTFDVRIEGKGVHLLGDPMFNNNGPGGSPPNAATMLGVVQGDLLVQATALNVLPEVQEICNIKCECEAEGRGEECIWKELAARDKASGFTSKIKPQVPYNMDPPGGGSPTPYMSQNEPRPTTNWFIGGSRRPDAVIVSNGSLPPVGSNIRAVVEIKLGDMGWNLGQREAYTEIAGGNNKLLLMNDENCKCPEKEKKPVPVPVPAREREESPGFMRTMQQLTGLTGAALIAYIIVSEGSRLFPPRNLVPVP